ncbi:Oxygen tolerance [Poseidonocella pacifica]|uniref:Oxygen tolerance n=1 Tax=Poseidonocella pacifica TaxID=871651 RepID=A0A1I0YGE6_9RHOB|nr:BatD family protein [Poseidonocella pacifica]SFB12242.1 Oxygen tolerance [Poseidonocella pacifica]
MRWVVMWFLVLTGVAGAQTSEVFPDELRLTVTVEQSAEMPFQGEMILLTIHGAYRRHITLENLVQPDLEGFNWMQLGEDHWYETRESGRPVKNFRRRMALFPENAGELTIGAFTHELTLTDEGDDWFDHAITSEPVTITVRAAPATEGWWLPVRSLRVSDQWSNAPDQLQPGEGVLRVIRVEAVGASPEMLPPMPELTSPSAMIFPHPEKRLVELSPEGPIAYTFWRWTIQPTNTTSAIVEPIVFDYFNTQTRQSHEVNISAQRIAYTQSEIAPVATVPDSASLRPGGVMLGLCLGVGLAGVALLAGRRVSVVPQNAFFDPLRRQLRAGLRRDDPRQVRRAMAALMRRDGSGKAESALLSDLDAALFAPTPTHPDLRRLVRAFVTARRKRATTLPTETIG